MKYIQYNSSSCNEVEDTKSEYKPENLDKDLIHWFNIPISDNETVLQFCRNFNIHDLTTSDISNANHLPKLDEFENYLYFIGKHAYVDKSIHQINIEHFSMILGGNYVLCFYEGKFEEIINYIYDHIISKSVKIDQKEADFLFYLIIDKVVDKYLDVIEFIREEAEDLEEITLEQDPENRTKEIIGIKANLNKLRKFINPMVNIISTLKTEKNTFIKDQTTIYLQDIFDHVIHNLTNIDGIHVLLKDILDLQQSFLVEKANQVMKTLTIVATIFIPLTFLVGVYGMNFDYLPEIHYKWSYPLLWIFMLLVTAAMFIYMKYKKWL
jgi:magnesium transporter